MKSPFPRMDPYVECSDLWEDFHDDLIADMKRALAGSLPKGYLARTRKRCYLELVEAEGKKRHALVPDVSVTSPRRGEPSRTPSEAKAPPGATGLREPVAMRAYVDTEYQEKFIDVYELRPERRLVTSIEVLSPTNKVPQSVGWKKYLRKRKALLLGKANLVEFDLLRGGTRMPMLDPWSDSPYAILVARQEDVPDCRVWPASFAWPLPAIPIPLGRPGEEEVKLDVQSLIASIYERNHYADEIDYAKPLVPPLRSEEVIVVEQVSGIRPAAARRRRQR